MRIRETFRQLIGFVAQNANVLGMQIEQIKGRPWFIHLTVCGNKISFSGDTLTDASSAALKYLGDQRQISLSIN